MEIPAVSVTSLAEAIHEAMTGKVVQYPLQHSGSGRFWTLEGGVGDEITTMAGNRFGDAVCDFQVYPPSDTTQVTFFYTPDPTKKPTRLLLQKTEHMWTTPWFHARSPFLLVPLTSGACGLEFRNAEGNYVSGKATVSVHILLYPEATRYKLQTQPLALELEEGIALWYKQGRVQFLCASKPLPGNILRTISAK